MRLFEKELIEKRLSAYREKMIEKGLDGAIVTKRENYTYLSGFTGSSAILIITQKDAVLITDFRYVEQAALQSQAFEIIQYQASLMDKINEIVSERNVQNLGFEEADVSFEKYNEYVTKLNIKEFIPMGGIIEKLRIVKDTSEIEIIQKATQIADEAFMHILNYIKPGVSEMEIAAEMEHQMKRLGAKGASFEIIVASGKRSSLPHGVASDKVIENGDTITLDFGALYREYCSDMTRTVFLGKPSEEMKKIYNIVLESQLKALEGSISGVTGKAIDKIARDYITEAGYGENFGHGLGHGVGLEIHEEPRLSKMGNVVMEDGMVVTVEPGIYVNGLGGVRIEDIIVINGKSPIILSKSTKDIIVL